MPGPENPAGRPDKAGMAFPDFADFDAKIIFSGLLCINPKPRCLYQQRGFAQSVSCIPVYG